MIRHTQEATSVAFSRDGKLLASGSKDKTTKVWDVDSGVELLQLVGGVRGVAFAADGQTVANTGIDATFRCWSTSDGRELAYYRMRDGGSGWAIAYSPDGSLIASAGQSKYVKVWKVHK